MSFFHNRRLKLLSVGISMGMTLLIIFTSGGFLGNLLGMFRSIGTEAKRL